jgi:hypothetical protein
MAGLGQQPPVDDKPPETSGPVAWVHILIVVAKEAGEAIGADVVVKRVGERIKNRLGRGCPERGQPVKDGEDYCPKCGRKLPRPPALHP